MSTWTKGLQTLEVSIPWAWEEVVTRQKVQITKGSSFWSISLSLWVHLLNLMGMLSRATAKDK